MISREPDYYAILNLPPESSIAEVREQYRRLAKIFHPDRNSGDTWCEDQLKRYNQAYSFLADEHRKAAYDERCRVRASDASAFTKTFVAPSPEDVAADAATPWSFDAADAHAHAQGDSADNSYRAVSSGAIFGEAVIAAPNLNAGVARDTKKRSALIRYSLGIFSAAVLVTVLIVINTEPDSVPSPAPFKAAASSLGPPDPRVAVGSGANTPIPLPILGDSTAPISKADDNAADSQRHAEAIALKARVTPYWSRYSLVKPRAMQAVQLGQQALSQMQEQDRHTPGGSPKFGSLRYEAEAKLWTDVNSMRSKLIDVDAAFDDLQYPATDDDVDAELTQLDSQLKQLERSSDPLFTDLGTEQNSGRQTPASQQAHL